MQIFYGELANWWHLVSDPADYAEEVDFFLPLLADTIAGKAATLLELGSGGGNNALHLKEHFATVTLVDLAPEMLAVSHQINPECEHLVGDMRTVRLNRLFDVVFIHDAIDYMTTLHDLQQALETAWVHCKSGGVVLLVPDHVRETFEPSTDHGGHDGDRRGVRYLEWSSAAPDPHATTYFTDYVFILRGEDGSVQTAYERHICGLFGRDEWLTLLAQIGFQVTTVTDPFERLLFVARKM